MSMSADGYRYVKGLINRSKHFRIKMKFLFWNFLQVSIIQPGIRNNFIVHIIFFLKVEKNLNNFLIPSNFRKTSIVLVSSYYLIFNKQKCYLYSFFLSFTIVYNAPKTLNYSTRPTSRAERLLNEHVYLFKIMICSSDKMFKTSNNHFKYFFNFYYDTSFSIAVTATWMSGMSLWLIVFIGSFGNKIFTETRSSKKSDWLRIMIPFSAKH